ncbi:TonB-dependent receptor [Subsaximicrobium wynnwilliamsii]|uniref:TonB-dependent receptor n=1 Tax=Subsaximicrobium wynnwilliamsii TaxID=291179 RepID=A0A5C6ZJD2_9FLAO|nr:TonB-dependent receptor [Subsaximicrobium wynnwilliamsii]TXD84248.1 TonB-dependent receptor [Subsaximicrobium wynnwilliamsii]TXD89869.1 TonB-dependent receptor [Subsaximicrobium wynnwilliamsii]TXE03960.1 TonB-dependent receptor [Subsaximicrobium wynnwilliamsii]
MRLKDFKLLIATVLTAFPMLAQNKLSGYVTNQNDNSVVANVEVYDKISGLLTSTDSKGYYEFSSEKNELTLVFYKSEFEIWEQEFSLDGSQTLNIILQPLQRELSEIVINARKAKVFELNRLKDVEGTAIYAGKKTEVVLVEQSLANLATNNARQVFSQVAGLNIYQNDDAGLQLNIGGRGLDPNRTANFNTRQNGYDISADVLGYPESYYTPATEGLKEIQVIRGAASLQYGTQFGGLINFKTKDPNPNKPIELITRNTLGSFGLYTNFTSLSGTKGKFSYYTYFNYKTGDGFRPNSEFESKNVFAHLGYKFDEKTSVSAEFTHLYYLAQQGGGLTDRQFNEDAFQSNRERNWFKVNWLLYNFKLKHKFSEDTNFTFNAFGLNASRDALGFRSNRVDLIDPNEERDLIKGEFRNYGAEARLLSKYDIFGKKATFLIGSKFYKADNKEQQGPGSDGFGPDFDFYDNEYPNYPDQSRFEFPNLNVAVFGENIFYVNDKFSVTPGFRFEYIKTESEGFYKRINTDAAGNVIFEETLDDNRDFERNFVLLGLGLSYKPSTALEIYGNISQNYRSVTYSDINITNPAFAVDPNITDEDGFTADLGIRGNYKNAISYDLDVFGLYYNGRIGFVQKVRDDGRTISERGNVGDARMFGVESLVDFNLKQILGMTNDFSFNYFVNASFINSEYTDSKESGVVGKKVEFVPDANIKSGLRFGYLNLMANVQYTYLSKQFTDATNSEVANLSGVIGAIPQYDILDFSLSYTYKRFKLETGVNNFLDNSYFTRRATGYPGPGIIPSAPRNWYATLQIKL